MDQNLTVLDDRITSEQLAPLPGLTPPPLPVQPQVPEIYAQEEQSPAPTSGQTLLAASHENPDQYAEAARIAGRLRIPPEMVAADIGEWKRNPSPELLAKIRGNYPHLDEWLREYGNAAVAHDDVSNLVFLTDQLGNLFSGSAVTMGQGLEGRGTYIKEHGQLMQGGPDNKYANIRLKALGMLLEAGGTGLQQAGKAVTGGGEYWRPPPERQGIVGDIVQGVAQVATQMAVAVLSPAEATGMLFGQGLQQQYDRLDAAGVTDLKKRSMAAGLGGAVTFLTEKLELGLLMKGVPGLEKVMDILPAPLKNKWVKYGIDITGAAGAEAIQETIENLFHDVIEYGVYNDDVEFLKGAREQAQTAGIVGGIARTLVLGITRGRAINGSPPTDQIGNRATRENVLAGKAAVEATKLATRDPEKMAEVLRMTGAAGLEVRLDPTVTTQLFQSGIDPESLYEQAPELRDQIEQADATGNDIVLSMDTFLSILGNKQLGDLSFMADFVKVDPETSLEDEGVPADDAAAAERVQKILAEAQTEQENADRYNDNLAIEEEVARQVSDALRNRQNMGEKTFSAAEADAVARLVRDFAAAELAKRGDVARAEIDKAFGTNLAFLGPRKLAALPPSQTDFTIDRIRTKYRRTEGAKQRRAKQNAANLFGEKKKETPRARPTRTPIINALIARGGISTQSRMAGDLAKIGITPKSYPRLFVGAGSRTAKAPMRGLDNIPVTELENEIPNSVFKDDGNGYVDVNDLMDRLRDEIMGNPFQSDEELLKEQMDAADQDVLDALNYMGVDIESASNQEIRDALARYEQEQRDSLYGGVDDPYADLGDIGMEPELDPSVIDVDGSEVKIDKATLTKVEELEKPDEPFEPKEKPAPIDEQPTEPDPVQEPKPEPDPVTQGVPERYEKIQKTYQDVVRLVSLKDSDPLGAADGLIGIIANLDNKLSREAFTELTGATLPKTVKGTREAVDAWAGLTEDDLRKREEKETVKRREADERRLEREIASEGASLSRIKVQGAGTLKEYLDDMIARGFNALVPRKEGAATTYFLSNAEGKGYSIKFKGAGGSPLRYIRAVLELTAMRQADMGKIKESDPAPDPQDHIADFGEKIGGARKDVWQDYGKRMTDALPDDLKLITLSKHFPEPDYEGLIAQGVDVNVLAAIKAMRDLIPSKPRQEWKLREWVKIVTAFRDHAAKMIDGTASPASVLEIARSGKDRHTYSQLEDKIVLYMELGYPAFTRAADYSFRSGYYSVHDGVKYPENVYKVEVRKGYSRLKSFDTRAEAVNWLRSQLSIEPDATKTDRSVKLDIYQYTRTGEIVIGKIMGRGKQIDLKGGFKDRREAMQFLKDNEKALLVMLEKRKDVPPERRSVNDPRRGEDYRRGDDVTPEKFAAEFGFRGVEFGNYVEQKRRADDLNNAYDALMDMVRLIGVPSRAVSLNGSLGLAFGARGRGGKNAAAAHYETDFKAINLTKTGGKGSLGHEWWHALDNFFGAQQQGRTYLTENPSLRKLDKDGKPITEPPIRPEVVDAFKGVMEAIKKTEMLKRSRELDKTRSKDYWSTDIEMSARAFEAYLIHKAAQKGESNDYLANVTGKDAWEALVAGGDSYPYPTAQEMTDVIGPAFDSLFATLKTKETPKGVTFYQFAGERAKGADLAGLEAAKKAIKAGEDEESIRKRTGWFLGADKKWRFEISDDEARMIPGRHRGDMREGLQTSVLLGDLIEHKKLFAAYPYARNLYVLLNPDQEGASYDRATGTIEMGYDSKTLQIDMPTLMHEIQHHIQMEEGFAIGGNELLLPPQVFEQELPRIIERAKRVIAQAEAEPERFREMGFDIPFMKERLKQVQEKGPDALDPMDKYMLYRRLYGEIEAWNTAARTEMTPEERKKTSPQKTQEIQDNQAFVIFADGTQLPAPERAVDGQTGTAQTFNQPAYHGSPYRFDKFTLDHIGKGEGAQAYGWGLYFAGNKEVAEFYRQQLSIDKRTLEAMASPYNGFQDSEAIRMLRQSAKNSRDNGRNGQAIEYEETALWIEKGRPADFGGQLYEVAIPEDDVLLHWDKTLSEQPPKVLEVLSRLGDTIYDTGFRATMNELIADRGDIKGMEIYKSIGRYAKIDDESISKKLNEFGIKGIKYLDGMARKASAKFNGGAIPKGNTAAELAAEKLDLFDDTQKALESLDRTVSGNFSGYAKKYAAEAAKLIRDGTITYTQGDSYNYVIFDDSSIQTLQTFYQSSDRQSQYGSAGPRGSYQFDAINGKSLIQIFEGGDKTTILHELGHHFLRYHETMARRDASALEDYGDLFKWYQSQKEDVLREAAVYLPYTYRKNKGGAWTLYRFGAEYGAEADEAAARAAVDGLNKNVMQEFGRDGRAIMEDMLARRTVQGSSDVSMMIGTSLNERFARGFESYLFEGRAPSKSLEGVFDRFKAWFLQVYKSLSGLNIKLDPNVRRFFDRMLATDEAIEAYRNRVPMGVSQETLSMLTASQKKDYLARHEKELAEAKNKLLRKALRELRREDTKWWKEESDKFRGLIEERLKNDPVYRAIHFLQTGQDFDGNPITDGPFKLDEGMVVGLYENKQTGKESLKYLPRSTRAKAGTGLDPKIVADMFGFKSAMDFIQRITEAKPYAARVAEEVETEMVGRHGDMLNDGSIDDRALEQVMSELPGHNLIELESVLDQTGEKAPTQEDFAKAAEVLLARTGIERAIKPERYRQAAVRAVRAYEKALAKKDYEAAAKAKRTEILNKHLYRQSVKARDFVNKSVDHFGKLSLKPKSGKVPPIDPEYHEKIWEILDKYNVGPRLSEGKRTRLELKAINDWIVAKERDENAQLLMPPEIESADTKTHYRDMTLEEFKGLSDLITNIETQGRNKQEFRIGQDKRALAELVSELDETARQYNTERPVSISERAEGRKMFGKKDTLISKIDAVNTKVQQLCVWLDGGRNDGLWTRTVYQPIFEAEARRHLRERVEADKWRALVEAHYGDEPGGFAGLLQKEVVVDGLLPSDGTFRMEYVLSAALNQGNPDNQSKFIDGWAKARGWNESMINKILRENMREKDWAFVQAVWKYENSFWEETSAVERRRFGYPPEKIEAVPFEIETSDGKLVSLEGGYHRIKYDYDNASAEVADRHLGQREAETYKDMITGRQIRAQTPRGSMKERVTYTGLPIRLDLDVIPEHVSEQIGIIEMSEAAENVARVLRQPLTKQVLREILGDNRRNMIDLWLEDVVSGGRLSSENLNSVWRMMRRNYTVSRLAIKPLTVILQVTGFAHTVADMGPSALYRGIDGPLRIKEIRSKSSYMAGRAVTMTRDINDALNYYTQKGAWVRQKAATLMLMPMQKMQEQIDAVTWMAAYRKYQSDHVGESYSEDDAIAQADMAVSRNQGGGMISELAAIERGTLGTDTKRQELVKAGTLFFTYFNAKYNLLKNKTIQFQNKQISGTELFGSYLMAILVEGVISQWIMGQLDFGDDDDEVTPGSVAKSVLWASFSNTAAMFPLGRDVAGALQGFSTQTGPERQLDNIAGAAKGLFNLATDLLAQGEEPNVYRAAQSVIDGASVFVPFPASVLNQITRGLEKQDREGEASLWDYLVYSR